VTVVLFACCNLSVKVALLAVPDLIKSVSHNTVTPGPQIDFLQAKIAASKYNLIQERECQKIIFLVFFLFNTYITKI
jgi:hypothetical protein